MVTAAAVNQSDLDLFFEDLHQKRDRVLLLDYDGTIAPFSPRRDHAFPYPGVPELLQSIMRTCRTRVALISGRSARELPTLLGLTPHPEIWGVHGLERLMPDGSYSVAAMSGQARRALDQASAWIEQQGLERCAERKCGAVAVHWRGLNAQEAETLRAMAYRALWPLARQSGLYLQEFDGGLELRARDRCKADAVQMILAQEAEDTCVAYLGDDHTDEDAFRYLHGRGLTVLVRPIYRFTAAQLWLRPPAELVQFLADWIGACGGEL
jgi:trehalose 6-phosphate phosphatase